MKRTMILLMIIAISMINTVVYGLNVRGVFRIMDESGTLLDGVTVECRHGNDNWTNIGVSQYETTLSDGYSHIGARVNFIQDRYVASVQKGQEVVWRFMKQNYKMKTFSVYVSDSAEYYKEIILESLNSGNSQRSNYNSERRDSERSNSRGGNSNGVGLSQRLNNSFYGVWWCSRSMRDAYRLTIDPNTNTVSMELVSKNNVIPYELSQVRVYDAYTILVSMSLTPGDGSRFEFTFKFDSSSGIVNGSFTNNPRMLYFRDKPNLE
ncbi:MAG: hypothetical protein WCI51_06580 [Lentisphaerota bacterium]